MAGQAEEGISAYTDYLSNRNFINLARPRKIVDIDFLIDQVLEKDVQLDYKKLQENSESKMNIGIVSASDASMHWAQINQIDWSLKELFRATTALPIFYGREVQLGSDQYVDGGLLHALPLQAAISKETKHVLVITTRPVDCSPTFPKKYQRYFIQQLARKLGHSPAVVRSLWNFDYNLQQAMASIRAGQAANGQTKIWSITTSKSIVSRLTLDRNELLYTVDIARQDTLDTLLR